MKFSCFLLFLFPALLAAANCTWTGGGSDKLWNNPDNWDCGTIPGPNDEVTLNNNADPELSTDVSLAGLSTSSCTISGTGHLSVSGLCRISSGSNFDFTGDLITNGTFEWRGGTITGNGAVIANGNVNFLSQGRTLVNRTLHLNAGGEWSRGLLSLGDNARLQLPAGQNWAVSNGFLVLDSGDNNGINIQGTLTGTASTGDVRVPLTLSGTFSVGGNYNMQGGGDYSGGSLVIATGKQLDLGSGDYELASSSVSGTGTFKVGSGGNVNFPSGSLTSALTIRGGFTYNFAISPLSLSLEGGEFAGLFPLTLTGDLNWRRGTISGPAPLTVLGTTTIGGSSNSLVLNGIHLTLKGDAEILTNSGGLTFNNAALLEVDTGVIFTKANNNNVNTDGSDARFLNRGTLRFTSIQDQLWIAPITSPGRMELAAGATVSLVEGGDFRQGDIDCAGGAVLRLNNGVFRLDGTSYTADAPLAVTGGTVRIDGVETIGFALDFGPSSLLTGEGEATFTAAPPLLGGKIAPGNSPGTLSLGPNLDLSAATTEIEVTDTGFDQLTSPGNLQLGGPLRVTESGTVAAGSYLILRCEGGPNCLTGDFSNVNLPNDDYQVEITGSEVRLLRAAALPVSWRSFTGRARGKVNELNWSTSSELEQRGFYVERSSRGQHFTSIGFVAGRGSAAMETTYTFTDKTPLTTTVFYRLRSVDYDATEQFSQVISVRNATADTRLLARTQVQSGDQVFFSAPGHSPLAWQLVDANGRTLRRGTAGESNYLRTAGLLPGLYFFYAGGQVERLLVR